MIAQTKVGREAKKDAFTSNVPVLGPISTTYLPTSLLANLKLKVVLSPAFKSIRFLSATTPLINNFNES